VVRILDLRPSVALALPRPPNGLKLCGLFREGIVVVDDSEFIREFEACRWPLEQWHHRDHIKLAYLYLRRHTFDESLARIRAGIKAHNSVHKVPGGLTSGYHETMTHAWLRLVSVTLSEYGPAESADSFYEQHPELSQKKTLRLFYSRERLVSDEAKAGFVEPDLAPLPHSQRNGGAA
jgi:hypothetical protein